MKNTLQPGLRTAASILVDEQRVIEFLGKECHVYATPRIISDVEFTCRNYLLSHLDPGEDSVGTKVNVEHLGPALLGARVTIDVLVKAVDGRRVTFEAEVRAGADRVLAGLHERFVVDTAKVRERLLKKRAQMDAGGNGPPGPAA